MLRVQGWGNLSFIGAYDHSCKNGSTMYISAQCEFADIPIALFPGWDICSICTHFPERSRHGSESRKYSKGRGGKGPHSHYRYYTSLAVCSRFLALFAQNGEPVHRLTFSTPTLWDFCITVELLAFATFRRKKLQMTRGAGGRARLELTKA